MITIDTNVLVAGLLRDSTIRHVLLNGTFAAPYTIILELQKHREEFLRKSGLSEKNYEDLVALLLSSIRILMEEDLFPHTPIAAQAVADIDPDDAPFIACALAARSILWSDDAALKRQNAVVVKSTKEMLEFEP